MCACVRACVCVCACVRVCLKIAIDCIYRLTDIVDLSLDKKGDKAISVNYFS